MSSGESDYERMNREYTPVARWHPSHSVSVGDVECLSCGALPHTRLAVAACSKSPVAAVFLGVDLASKPDVQSYDLFPGNRKDYPVLTGALMYFPFAMAALADCSRRANEQHNPGEPVHWDYAKSIGDGNELLRHLMDSLGPNPVDAEGVNHDVKVLWRAAETVERRIRRERGLEGPAKPNAK